MLMVDRIGHVVQELGKPMPAVSGAAVSPDGRRVALQSNPGLWVYDLSSNTLARSLKDDTKAAVRGLPVDRICFGHSRR